jgi:hypothetical protein
MRLASLISLSSMARFVAIVEFLCVKYYTD